MHVPSEQNRDRSEVGFAQGRKRTVAGADGTLDTRSLSSEHDGEKGRRRIQVITVR